MILKTIRPRRPRLHLPARVHPLLRSPRTYSRRRAAADDGQAGAHPRGESRANAEFLFRQAPQKRDGWLMSFTAGAVCGYRSERRRWWQDHRRSRKRFRHGRSSSAELNGGDANSQNVPLDTSAPAAPTADSAANSAPTDTASAPTTSAPAQTPADNAVVAPSANVDTAGTTPAAPATTQPRRCRPIRRTSRLRRRRRRIW